MIIVCNSNEYCNGFNFVEDTKQRRKEKEQKGKKKKKVKEMDVSFYKEDSDMIAMVRTKVKLQKILIHYVCVKIIIIVNIRCKL